MALADAERASTILCQVECAWGLPAPSHGAKLGRSAVVQVEHRSACGTLVSKARTSVQPHSLDPVWQELLCLEVDPHSTDLLKGALIVQLWDTAYPEVDAGLVQAGREQNLKYKELLGTRRVTMAEILRGELALVQACPLHDVASKEAFTGVHLFWCCRPSSDLSKSLTVPQEKAVTSKTSLPQDHAALMRTACGLAAKPSEDSPRNRGVERLCARIDELLLEPEPECPVLVEKEVEVKRIEVPEPSQAPKAPWQPQDASPVVTSTAHPSSFSRGCGRVTDADFDCCSTAAPSTEALPRRESSSSHTNHITVTIAGPDTWWTSRQWGSSWDADWQWQRHHQQPWWQDRWAGNRRWNHDWQQSWHGAARSAEEDGEPLDAAKHSFQEVKACVAKEADNRLCMQPPEEFSTSLMPSITAKAGIESSSETLPPQIDPTSLADAAEPEPQPADIVENKASSQDATESSPCKKEVEEAFAAEPAAQLEGHVAPRRRQTVPIDLQALEALEEGPNKHIQQRSRRRKTHDVRRTSRPPLPHMLQERAAPLHHGQSLQLAAEPVVHEEASNVQQAQPQPGRRTSRQHGVAVGGIGPLEKRPSSNRQSLDSKPSMRVRTSAQVSASQESRQPIVEERGHHARKATSSAEHAAVRADLWGLEDTTRSSATPSKALDQSTPRPANCRVSVVEPQTVALAQAPETQAESIESAPAQRPHTPRRWSRTSTRGQRKPSGQEDSQITAVNHNVEEPRNSLSEQPPPKVNEEEELLDLLGEQPERERKGQQLMLPQQLEQQQSLQDPPQQREPQRLKATEQQRQPTEESQKKEQSSRVVRQQQLKELPTQQLKGEQLQQEALELQQSGEPREQQQQQQQLPEDHQLTLQLHQQSSGWQRNQQRMPQAVQPRQAEPGQQQCKQLDTEVHPPVDACAVQGPCNIWQSVGEAIAGFGTSGTPSFTQEAELLTASGAAATPVASGPPLAALAAAGSDKVDSVQALRQALAQCQVTGISLRPGHKPQGDGHTYITRARSRNARHADTIDDASSRIQMVMANAMKERVVSARMTLPIRSRASIGY